MVCKNVFPIFEQKSFLERLKQYFEKTLNVSYEEEKIGNHNDIETVRSS